MAAENFKSRFDWRNLRKPGKNLFWAWIAYQTIKGTLTTTLIWLPLLYMWKHQ